MMLGFWSLLVLAIDACCVGNRREYRQRVVMNVNSLSFLFVGGWWSKVKEDDGVLLLDPLWF